MERKFFYLLFAVAILFVRQNGQAQSSSCHSGKVDPRVAFLLQAPDLTLEQLRAMSIEEMRKKSPPNDHPVPENKMQRIKITADSIPVIIFKPDQPTKKLLPVIIDYHGGSFFAPLQPWMYGYEYGTAQTFNAVVFAVDYPVAPEHKFPVPVTASYKAFKWLAQHATRFGGDTSKLMLSGGSSGANIAAAVSLLARDEGIQRKIKLVSLFCPAVDSPINSPYPSYKENGRGHLITETNAIWVLENYTGTNSPDVSDFRLFPLHAKSLKGLPPTLVFTAEFDILRDEGEAYANKLRTAGVPVHYRCFPSQLHTMAALPDDAEEWKQMDNDTKAFMMKYF